MNYAEKVNDVYLISAAIIALGVNAATQGKFNEASKFFTNSLNDG